MNFTSKQAVPWIKNLEPYNGGKPISEIASKLNLSEHQIVKLASNENPLGMSPKVKLAISQELQKVSRYPDGNCTVLKKMISNFHGVSSDQIFLGNGSNDVLDCLARTFLRKGVSAVYSKYSFAVYGLATISAGANSIIAPATENLEHSLSAFISSISGDTRMIFIANPNNPTGSYIKENEIRSFLRHVDKSILVVLDEAYCDYLEGTDLTNSIQLLKDYSNLFITRSFSKAYGLAGLRVGYGIGNKDIVSVMNSIRQPFNVNYLAQIAAITALEDQDFIIKSKLLNKQVMRELIDGLSTFGIRCLSSRGNFVLANIGENFKLENEPAGVKLFESLLSLGVITRPVRNYDLADWLRISVGTQEENRDFLNILPQALDLMAKDDNSN